MHNKFSLITSIGTSIRNFNKTSRRGSDGKDLSLGRGANLEFLKKIMKYFINRVKRLNHEIVV